MSVEVISISGDYSSTPAGRTMADGPFNGQRFRDDFLIPAIRSAIGQHTKVIVNFDGADSYSSSFLEEAFGGLVRSQVFPYEILRASLELQASDPIYAPFVADARQYMDDEFRRARH
ncbi:STAS-like domain-containing protein [Labrys sp. (in: a-proteobacteria)]|uniref:STAS-like domain-containing protein n=1 Tax=Labrys sp. (in: a-proteobacteria) TaxID=1917972 RepID=UPI0039E55BAA